MGGNDYSTATFLSKTHLDIPLIFHSNVLATDMTNRLHPVLEKIHDTTGIAPVIAYERNNGGVFEIERLASMNRANKYRIYTMMTYGDIQNSEERKLGWSTNTATRPKMLGELKEAVDQRLLTIYDKPLLTEMYSFIINKQGKAEAEVGAHDDLVMSTAIAWQLYQTENAVRHNVYKPYNRDKWSIH
jgi:hypothetical protein